MDIQSSQWSAATGLPNLGVMADMKSTPGVLSKRTLGNWIGALVLIALVASITVGFMGAKHIFDFALAAGIGTAVGTVLLAGFTGALAWTTRDNVRATWGVAELTRQDQENRSRPFVLAYVIKYTPGETKTGQLTVVIANAGLAPAMKITIRGQVAVDGAEASVCDMLIPYMQPGGTRTEVMDFQIDEAPAGGLSSESFALCGSATDAAGNSYRISFLGPEMST